MTPLLNKVFSFSIELHEDAKRVIYEKVMIAIYEGTLPLGTRLPTIREVAKRIKVSRRKVELAWMKLKSHGYVVTYNRKGSFVASYVQEPSGIKLREIEEVAKAEKIYSARFDQECIIEWNSGSTGFQVEWNKALKRCADLTLSERKAKYNPTLLRQFETMLTTQLAYSFSGEEVYFTDDYQQLITYICDMLLTGDKVLVLTKPVQSLIKIAASIADKDLVYIGSDDQGMLMDELEQNCLERNVAVVYLSSGAPFPVNYLDSPKRISLLMELQRKYRFVILLDDRYPGFVKIPNLLGNLANGRNRSIIYLRPVSLLHADLNEINIIAAPKRIMRRLKQRFVDRSRLMPIAMGKALTLLIQAGTMVKYELKAKKIMRELIVTAKTKLLKSGLWKEFYLNQHQGWFFYLEPVNGEFVEDTFRQLGNANISIIDPGGYDAGPVFKKGLLISTSAYLNTAQMKKDMYKKEKFMKTMIK